MEEVLGASWASEFRNFGIWENVIRSIYCMFIISSVGSGVVPQNILVTEEKHVNIYIMLEK